MSRNTVRRGLLGCTAASVALFSMFSCVEVNDSLGTDYIPNDQIMGIKIDSTFQIKTYNVTTDSIPSSGYTANFIGSYVHPKTGKLNAEAIFQYGIPDFANADSLFGINPVIDSLFLQLYVARTMGRKDVEQTFDLYELTQRICYDSTYYSDFDPKDIVKKTPLLSFTVKGDSSVIRRRITDVEFINRLKDTTGYWNDTLFQKRFPGFYIKPRVAYADAAVYTISTSYSSMVAHYHNDNPKKDTTFASYSFAPYDRTSYYYTAPVQCINMVSYDLSTVPAELRLNDKSQPVEKTYIQGYGGIATYLEFTKESVEAIRAKVKAAGFSDVVINKAKLEVAYTERVPENVDYLISRLGLYTDFKKFTPVPDYSYTMEQQGYQLPYGGYINRSKWFYEMDITMYVQRLFREEYDKRGVVLAPAMSNILQIDPLELYGYGSENPLRLIITYTMVR